MRPVRLRRRVPEPEVRDRASSFREDSNFPRKTFGGPGKMVIFANSTGFRTMEAEK